VTPYCLLFELIFIARAFLVAWRIRQRNASGCE
jgi:hypothetical protein